MSPEEWETVNEKVKAGAEASEQRRLTREETISVELIASVRAYDALCRLGPANPPGRPRRLNEARERILDAAREAVERLVETAPPELEKMLAQHEANRPS